MLSVIIPAYDEAESIADTVQRVRKTMDSAEMEYEIIVVDDGSSDDTAERAAIEGITLIRHPVNAGYGRALKTGIQHARYEWCAILDADGSYPIERLTDLLEYVPRFDMVVGARSGKQYWGSFGKRIARLALLAMVRFIVGVRVPDVNSGFRIFRKDLMLAHSQRISSGFSFTTTLTLAMILDERFVQYVPIDYHPRVGVSKVRMRRDSLRMLQILVQAVLYYNPLKIFLAVCLGCVAVGIVGGLLIGLANALAGLFFLGVAAVLAILVGVLGLLTESIRMRSIVGRPRPDA